MSTSMQFRFLGAAGTVTGSRHLLETPHGRILIDCGQFQGLKALRLRNREPLSADAAVSPAEIDAVLLTHGHLDHCGWLPVLMRQGFKGKVYCTEPTKAVASLVLRDSGKIQQEESDAANLGGWSKHKPAEPLFTTAEAERCLLRFETVEPRQWQQILPGLQARWRPVAHILGACFIEIETQGRRIVCSGDVGRVGDPLLPTPERPEAADILLLESTYGDRQHPTSQPLDALREVMRQTLERGGSLLIPGFAIERIQLLLMLMRQLDERGQLPNLPVLFDSPMAQGMLELFKDFRDWHLLDEQALENLTANLKILEHSRQSRSWAGRHQAKVVLAGSGMLSGGRILNYLEQELVNPKSTLLLTGYQAEGTRGRDLLDGAERIKLNGRWLPVRCQIRQLQGLSAHADQAGLLDWLSALKQAPRQVVLVHGEAAAATALQQAIQARYGWNALIAADRQVLAID